MNSYQRLFGSGPRGVFYSVVVFLITVTLKDSAGLPPIINSELLRYIIFGGCTLVTILVVIWSLHSLPVEDRGEELITSGAFRYFRHPLYAAFVIFFDFGFAVLLNNWIFIVWAILMIPVWQLTVRYEEKLMLEKFGHAYADYCDQTWRFFPKIQNLFTTGDNNG